VTENTQPPAVRTGQPPAAETSQPPAAVTLAGRGVALRAVVPVLVRDVVLPYALYYFLHRRGMANVPALAAGGAVNVFFTIVGLIRTRRVQLLGLIVLATFVLGIAASFLTGDARFALAKDSVLTGGVGIVFLLSLLAARPVMYLMIRQMLTEGDPARAAELDRRWDSSPGFRSRQRLMTGVWGAGLLADAVVRLVVIAIVPVSTGAAASTVILLGTFALLIAWTRLYLPYLQRREARSGR
jgi:hypothetical protein